MDCKDLMIGDWVNYKSPSSGKLRPIKIANIYGCEFNCEVENWNIISGMSISDTEPIPLTEEILVKNGFQLESKIEDDCLTYKCGNFHLFYYPDGTGLYSYNSQIVIGSVHQLQHLLRLCGIEKELTI
jgi:hypothetical protein